MLTRAKNLWTLICLRVKEVFVGDHIPYETDFLADPDVTRVLSRKVQRASADYVCDFTGKELPKGQPYIRLSVMYKKKFTFRRVALTHTELFEWIELDMLKAEMNPA